MERQIGSRASRSRLSDVQDCRVCGLFGPMHETYVLALVLLIGLCPNQELYLKFYLRIIPLSGGSLLSRTVNKEQRALIAISNYTPRVNFVPPDSFM